MPVEIERKFLVSDDSWRRVADRGVHIRQGYIVAEPHCSVRVRIVESGRCTLTTKLPRGGVSRFEFENDLSAREVERLMHLCEGAIIEKRRFAVSANPHIWEIDVYDGANAGLVVAEIELASEEETFDRPGWLGPEVTGVERYQNSRLSREPYSTWREGQETVRRAL